jgi:hypothetical protein
MNFLADGILKSSDVNLPQTPATHGTLTTLLNITFAIVGALAFLMIVIAGFRFVISGGEPQKVAEIRRQIIYAAIGLIVVGAAAAIVNFVLNRAA